MPAPLKVAITPIDTVNQSVQPKPTKTEVIEALFRLRIAELRSESDKAEAAKKAARQAIEEKIRKHVLRNAKTILKSVVNIGYKSGGSLYNCHVEFYPNPLPAELEREALAALSMEGGKRIDEKKVRQEIRENLGFGTGVTARVDALLSDKKTRGALHRMLVEIGVSSDAKAIEA